MPLALLRVSALTALFVFAVLAPAAAGLNPDLASPSIVLNLPSRTLEFYAGGELVKTYPVAIGKPSTPSPLGNFAIFEKEVDPWWFPPRTGEVVPSGPHNPLGYRWMGFAPMYGIHGTNAPWAIGLAVSNGCIRMREADVEELYEVVPCGTPVRVTYDRFKLRVEGTGEVSLGVYPDIYGRRELTAGEVSDALAARGLGGLLTDGELAAMIAEEADRQVVFARVHNVRVNGRMLAERAVTLKGVMYVPLLAVAGALEAKVSWDGANGMARGAKRAVPVAVIGDKVYVAANDAQALFGGQQVFREEENVLAVDVVSLFLNGRPLAGDVQVVEGVLAVPVTAVAEAVGQKVARGADGSLSVRGTKVPASLVGGEAYIQLTKVYDVFRAYVYWNQEARSIELTYPFIERGGND
ncbi:L,D-transpeptidase family protein [Anaeroselena agilis]|uniref:L,D-transpeptidase family protein n=1 Tax=Anaeroselena agilis TaxID=3063788 RepID=A0ABU3NY12_9FIRM|nr:L,D-transpeptidase family protein [Selenomonadales bacterium 4137-cl]